MTHPEQPAPHMPTLAPGSVFAGYLIEGVLDRGGMGVVYRAQDPELDRPVALKIIAPEHTQNPTAVARFKAEARLAASLEHPNIVPIHRGGEQDGVLYLAMRLVSGTNLRRVIDSGALDLDRVARITTQIADALDAAHARGLVHRDVKPGNILVSGEGEHEHVYLTDFGLTKRLGSNGDLTRTGGWVGTPDYVAPEQIQGRDVDGRADVYSLGCVVYEMLTGHVAYPKSSDMAKLWAHVTDPPPLPRAQRAGLVGDFDAVVAKATAKEPEDRYASAGALAAAVRDAVAEQEAQRQRGSLQDTAGGEMFPPTVAGGLTQPPPYGVMDDPTLPPAPPESPRIAAVFPEATQPPPSAQPPSAPPPAAQPPSAPAPSAPAPVASAAAAAPVAAAAAGGPPSPPASPGTPVAQGGPPGGPPGGGQRTSRSRRGPIIAGVAFVACAIAAVIVLTSGGSSDDEKAATPAETGEVAAGPLGAVPTNHVRGKGTVKVTLDGDVASVDLRTTGLVNAAHLMHIHAGAEGQCPDRSVAKTYNGHRAIGTLDGAPFYGPVVTSLTTKGSTSEKELLDFGAFPFTGDIDYKRKINVGPVVAAQIRANNAVIVVHGIDYNGNTVYDNVLDRSDISRRYTNESTAPALCGTLLAKPTGGDQKTASAGSTTYTATFVDAPDNPGWRLPDEDSWQYICHLGGTATTL